MKFRVSILPSILALIVFALTSDLEGQTMPAVVTLYSFASSDTPIGGLVRGSDGNFYGTTYNGYSSNDTVFRISSGGVPTILNSIADGGVFNSGADLVQGSDGSFYGTTYNGGTGNGGTIFRIASDSGSTILHSFMYTDGAYPSAGLVQGSDGNFYGTTQYGGITQSGGFSSGGTVFRVTPSGTLTTLHSFTDGGTDGAGPYAALVQGSDGNFYGTTTAGGSNGKGTVFRMTPAGLLNTLYSFTGVGTDGANPVAELVQGGDGNLYGTTFVGGSSNKGTVFRITLAGMPATLYSFTGSGTDGTSPHAGLVKGSDGNYYGTTQRGGANGSGTVFKVNVALPLVFIPGIAGSELDDSNGNQLWPTILPADINAIALGSVPTNVTATAVVRDFLGIDFYGPFIDHFTTVTNEYTLFDLTTIRL